jgi:hypothetical protein
LATSKAVRADDVSGLNIATASFTEDAVTKDVQRVILNNSTDGTMATVGSAGLKVDPSGATSPVSIAATVNVRPSDGTNPVTKTFDLDSGAGTEYNLGVGLRKAASGGSVEAGTSSDPLRIDPTGTTVQPVSASSLPLPTGAATSAKQPAIGTAGTASADVLTVQGKAGMTAVVVDGSGVTQPVSGTFFQSTQPVSIAATVVVKADTAGNQANALKVDGSAVTQPVSGTVTTTPPSNASTNVAQLVGTAVDVNSGNKSAGTQRVVLATDQPALTNALKVDGSAVTQPVSGTVTTNQGTSPWVNQESATQVVTIARSSSNPASSGDNTIVAAQGVGKVIYVFAYSLSFSGTVNAKFTDGAAGTQKAFHYGVANSGGGEAVKPPSYLWSGTANTALILNLSGATAVACNISYFVI